MKIPPVISRLRKGDTIKLNKLTEIVNTLAELRDLIIFLNERGVLVIVENNKLDLNTAIITIEAVKNLKKGPPSHISKSNGVKGGRPRKIRKMSEQDAKNIWHSNIYKTNKEAIKDMTGWTLSAAWAKFGGSGR